MFERRCQPLHQYKREDLPHDPLKNVNASGGAKQTALYPVRFCLLSSTEQKENEDVSHDCTFTFPTGYRLSPRYWKVHGRGMRNLMPYVLL